MLAIMIKGFILGWSVAWPPGPINTEMIRRGLTGGFWRAYVVGLGACTGDFLWALVVAAGVGAVLKEDWVRPILSVISFLLLIYLAHTFLSGAWREWKKRMKGESITFDGKPQSAKAGYWLGLTMALVSPWNMAFWLAVMGSQSGEILTLLDSVILAASVVAGAATWGLVLSTAVKMGARFTTPAWEVVTRALTGLLMLVFAVILIIRFIESL